MGDGIDDTAESGDQLSFRSKSNSVGSKNYIQQKLTNLPHEIISCGSVVNMHGLQTTKLHSSDLSLE